MNICSAKVNYHFLLCVCVLFCQLLPTINHSTHPLSPCIIVPSFRASFLYVLPAVCQDHQAGEVEIVNFVYTAVPRHTNLVVLIFLCVCVCVSCYNSLCIVMCTVLCDVFFCQYAMAARRAVLK